MSFSYANPTSGPSAGGIGWFNFGNLTINAGQTVTGLNGTLNDGTLVTFDLSMTTVTGPSRSFVATSTPTYSAARFGTSGYTGILGNVALYETLLSPSGMSLLTLSNIMLKDINGNPINNYTAVVADAETTDTGEVWSWKTNGGGWTQDAALGAAMPTLVGLGTQTAVITGIPVPSTAGAYVLGTQSPTTLSLTVTNSTNGQQAVAVGFAVTRIKVEKNVGQRIDATDQFVLNIAGTPNNQATTSGAADGIQTEVASIFATPGSTYTISELMAAGSASVLSNYMVVVSAANSTPAGTVPPIGTLPINFTPALGDDVTYTILNAAPQSFVKTVDKAFADVGDVLTYKIEVKNPNNFPISNVLVTDATPAGTTYIGNLIVSEPYSGTSPDTGITITSIGADDVVTLSWQVQVKNISPIPNPITNYASVNVPGGTSGITNITKTQVNHAFVSVLKTVDKAYANVGDILTYTLLLNNAGNIAANNVTVTDQIPSGTTFVDGSIVSSSPYSGTLATGLTLTAPISSGGSETLSFKVKVGNAIPNPNPILNTATLAYAYTVDPNNPNGVTVSKTSNTASTTVSNATLSIIKKSDKILSYVGDKITYQIAVTNTGNVPANNVILTDNVPNGTSYVAGSLSVNVPFGGSPLTTINLLNPTAPNETVALSFQVNVDKLPNPNPIVNVAKSTFSYVVNPLDPSGVNGTAASNAVTTPIFKNNYDQQISDLINSVALQEAAIANIANAEGAKIQKMLTMENVTPTQLLCLNKSVTDMLESLSSLQSIMKQKLSSVECQISPICK